MDLFITNECMMPKQGQFGSKSDSSCYDALFTVRELSLSSKLLKNWMRIKNI
jgi:hypothetical protein